MSTKMMKNRKPSTTLGFPVKSGGIILFSIYCVFAGNLDDRLKCSSLPLTKSLTWQSPARWKSAAAGPRHRIAAGQWSLQGVRVDEGALDVELLLVNLVGVDLEL